MELNLKVMDAFDFYDTYVEWSEGHNFTARYLDELDQVYVCARGDSPIYSCFCWRTPSTFCVIGFPFSNPNASKEDKRGGLSFLFNGMLESLKNAGFRMVWTTSDTPPVEKVLQRVGFEKADVQVNQYIKVL